MGRVKELWADRIFFCVNCSRETEHYSEDGIYKCDECKYLENDEEYQRMLDKNK